MAYLAAVPLIASLVLLALAALPLAALGWNIPGHMLSAAIAYQVLQQENPQSKGNSSVGETSLVREPMASEASRRSRRRSCPRAVHAGGKVGLTIFRIRDASAQISTPAIRLTYLTPKHSVIASSSGGVGMFGSLGMPELIFIFVVALVVFGPSKLPELGKSLGEAIRGFKKSINEADKPPIENSDSRKKD
jgi:sec-independent protein translocase protein TatA